MAATVHKAFGRSQKGQALLEIALVTPLLLALALGVIELGRYAYVAILVGNAAHVGAAYGAQGVMNSIDTVGIAAAACNDFQSNGFPQAACQSGPPNGGQDNTLNVSSSVTCGCDNGGTISTAPGCTAVSNPNAGTCNTGEHWVVVVTVEASGPFKSLFNYPGIPSRVTVDRKATMRVAQQ